MRKKLITNEERVAKQLTTMLSDIRIDLDLVGYYLVQLSPNVIYNRLMVVADMAEEAKGNQHNDHQYRLF
jgi:hypothetical protein